MKIDVHNHFYPPKYLEELKKVDSKAQLEERKDQDPVLHYRGDYNILVPGHREIESRREDMERKGMDHQVLSFTTPGVHVERPRVGVRLARVVNDGLAEVSQAFDSFSAFAALPLQDPSAAAEELSRCVEELGFVGGTVFGNVNGRYLDSEEFYPVYEVAEEHEAPLFVHPTTPGQPEPYLDYRLVAMVGFLMDTTVSISRMILGGVFERFPRLQVIGAHLGGTLPYIQERLDRCWRAYPEVHKNLPRKPSAYLCENVYYDTVNFDPRALTLTRDFAGPDRLLLGSDYPHQIGDLNRSWKVIEELDWTQEHKRAILSKNAERVLF